MSREIKFRVWVKSIIDEESNMYFPEYISLLSNNGDGSIDKVYTRDYKFKEDTCEFTLLQYTGLKDKNGVEIYEGDIVKGFLGKVAQIKYGEYRAGGYDYYAQSAYGPHIEYFIDQETDTIQDSEVEVIGNIYQNGDLIK